MSEKRPIDAAYDAAELAQEAGGLAEHIREAEPGPARERLFDTLVALIDDAHEEAVDAAMGLEPTAAQATGDDPAETPDATTDGGTVVGDAPIPDAAPETPETPAAPADDAEEREWDPECYDDLRDAYVLSETMTDAAELFEGLSYSAMRHRFVSQGIHDPTSNIGDRAVRGPGWLSGPPAELLAALTPAECSMTVAELCDIVAEYDSLTTIHRQLPWDDWHVTTKLCGSLGLSDSSARLYDDANERCAVLREVSG